MSAIANALGSLVVRFTADSTDFHHGIESMESKLGAFSEHAAGVLTKLGGVLSFAAIADGAIEAAEALENADIRIARATGLSGEALHSLEESFRNVYSQSAASAEQITSAMTIIATRTGSTGDALEGLTLKLLKLSKIGNEDVAALGPLVTRVFGDWSISADKQGKAMDYLGVVSQRTGTSVSKLAEQVVYAGAPLRLLGYNFDEAAALIGKFEKEGVNTELVLGGMKAALQKFAKEGVSDTAGAWRDFVEGVKGGAITMQQVMDQVGAKRGADLFKAITEGRFEIDKSVKSFEELAAKGGDALVSLGGAFTRLKNAIAVALEPLAVPVLQVTVQAITILADAVIGFADAWKHPKDAAKGFFDYITQGAFVAAANYGAARGLEKDSAAFKDAEERLKQLQGQANKTGDSLKTLDEITGKTGGRLKTFADYVNEAHLSEFNAALNASAKLVAEYQDAWEITGKKLEYVKAQLPGLQIDLSDLAEAYGEATVSAKTLADTGVPEFFDQTAAAAETLTGIMHQLGLKTHDELRAAADAAGDLYQKVVQLRDLGVATGNDVADAYKKWQEAEQKAADITVKHAKQIDDSWTAVGKRIRQSITNDLAGGLTDIIFRAGSVSDAFKRMGEDIVDTILHKIIAQGISKAIDALSQMGGLLGKIGGLLGGTGGSGGGGVLGTTVGAAGGAASTIGQTAGSVAGAASSAASGVLSSALGFAQLGVSVVSGIVSGIQGARTNNLLAEIEESTRYTKGYLYGLIGEAQKWWPKIDMIQNYLWTVQEALLTGISSSMDFVVIALADIRNAAKGGGNSNTTNNVTINISNPDPAATAQEVANYLKRLSPAFGV